MRQVREYRSVLAVQPEYTNARWGLGFALIVNHQTDQAILELEKTVAVMNRSPGSLDMLATAYAHAGRQQDALTLISELKQRREKGYVPRGAFIHSHLALGDYDQAFFRCDQAYKEQYGIWQWIKVAPYSIRCATNSASQGDFRHSDRTTPSLSVTYA